MSEWTSLQERLPELGDWVLIYTPVKEDGLVEIAMLDLFKWFINPAMGYGNFKNVTHWTPLPDQPKK